MQVQLAPDAVGWATTALSAVLTVPVGGRHHPTAESYVQVERTGGGDGSRATALPQLTFDCYAGDAAAAAELANLTRANLQGMAGRTVAGVLVYRVNLEGVSDQPDPRAPELSRYAFTGEFHLRSEIMEVS